MNGATLRGRPLADADAAAVANGAERLELGGGGGGGGGGDEGSGLPFGEFEVLLAA
eukprot:SAG22_NODE_20828_length_262_cov_0.938650_1_plen_55_part_10